MSETTMTGIPVIDCTECGWRHPASRTHCERCGLATLFNHVKCKEMGG